MIASKQSRAILLLLAALSCSVFSQDALTSRAGWEGWVPFGNTSILAGVAGATTGPVARVWFENASPAVQLPGKEIFRLSSRADWVPSDQIAPPDRTSNRETPATPAGMKIVLGHPLEPTLLYAIGSQVYRSDDAGSHWTSLTRYRGISLIGEDLSDLAVNPLDPDDLLVASDLGVWRSRDGGNSWFNLGEGLPNFPVSRILAFPEGAHGLQVALSDGRVLEWLPGSVYGWKLLHPASPAVRRRAPAAARAFGAQLTAWESVREQLYVGLGNGSILASSDGGATWREFAQSGLGAVSSLAVDPTDERIAIAVAESTSGERVLLRTLNGGVFWDDWTPPSLRGTAWTAAAPAWEQGALLISANERLLRFDVDFRAMIRPVSSTSFRLDGLPADVVDLHLDPSGTLLFAVSRNTGIFTTELPGIPRSPMARRSADLSRGAAAPGSLLSVYGEPLQRLRANGPYAALLGERPGNTQVQLPYGLSSDRVELTFENAASQTRTMALPLRRAVPSIFLHPDGNPFVLHPGNGLFMDENNPLRPGTRFQVLLTGLGAVTPDWPTGMAAPLENPPEVLARVEALVNELSVPVTRATLAPGYAGIYLVEIELPAVADDGLTELRIVADGNSSNPVPLHVSYESP